MSDDDQFRTGVRGLAGLLLVVVLAGVLVGAGALGPDPATNDHPDSDDVGPDPSAFVGQQVTIGGTVVDTDPVVLRVRYGVDEVRYVTLVDVGEPVSSGDSISAFGTLTDEGTLDVDRALVRAPWETWYMYGVSFLGGLWVLGRIGRHWRLDRDRLALVPRGDGDG